MAISEVGATPQPEHNNDSIRKLHDEKTAKSIFNSLNKDGNCVIDENDGVDRSMLSALKKFVGNTLTLENLKRVAGKISDFIYTKADKYNGKDAQITYDFWGHILSVNTGAQNVSEARTHMGLDKEYIVGCNTGDIITYGREYEKNNGTQKDYFVWNPETKSMDFEWGVWSAKNDNNFVWYNPTTWF